MKEQQVKIIDQNVAVVHERLMESIIEDTKENVVAYNEENVFMGKVGAKKFYMLYKPAFMNFISMVTVLRGDISATEDNRTKVRYHYCKFRYFVVLSSILLAAITILALYAFFSNRFNFAGNFCIVGFWIGCILLYLFSTVSSKAAMKRLITHLEEICQ